jgi:hypothetical protein
MNTYICEGHQPAKAESLKEAAEIFAFRKARTEFGRSAKVAGLTQWTFGVSGASENGETGEFEAFIGHGRFYALEGHTIRFSVYRVDYEEAQ